MLLAKDEAGALDVEVYWKRMPGFYGQMYHVIHLDPEQDMVESTLIHEVLHILYPEAEEKRIAKMEQEIFKGLSDAEVRRLTRFLKGVTHAKPG